MNKPNQWHLYLSEFIGTALLLLSGLSLVIFMYGEGNIVTQYIPNLRVRQVISGFVWGCFGASIALSPVGKVSGAHINPAVTLAFRLFGKIDLRTSIGYILAQITGGIVGCLPLIAWGAMGKSIEYGATVPGQGYSTLTVLMGEVITTFCLVGGLILFIGFRNLRQYTPAMIPFLYGIMVPLEADISGTSTNPARSIGPAVIS
jgi:aquaporin Z